VVYFSIEMWLPFYLIYTDLAKNLTIRSQEAELAFLLEARSSRLEGKNSFRVRVHKLTAQLEAQLPAGVSRLLEGRSSRLEGVGSWFMVDVLFWVSQTTMHFSVIFAVY
jgi:hypothetical protein